MYVECEWVEKCPCETRGESDSGDEVGDADDVELLPPPTTPTRWPTLDERVRGNFSFGSSLSKWCLQRR